MAAGHQITITPTRDHVEVTLGGEKLAESDRAVLLNETGYPTRYYIPQEDVRMDRLVPSFLSTLSAQKIRGTRVLLK
jgi:uncharacterized protein (DUF427 family)